MQEKQTFLRIQILRFVAAAAVVFYHAQLTVMSYFKDVSFNVVYEMGVYGVDLFFVISGFIIVYIGSTRETSAPIFAKRRIKRIVPFYWIMTFATFFLTHIPGLARNEVSSPLHLLQSLFFMSWVNGPETYPVLNVGWTLEFEMFFYVIAALAMATASRRWLVAGLFMLGLVLVGHGTSFFLLNPIMIEFVFGMTVGAFLFDRRNFAWLLAATSFVLVTLPVTGAAWRVWAIGLPAAGLIALAIALDLRKVYRGKILPELGNASYSIYLTHVIAISFACKIAAIVTPHIAASVLTPLISIFAIVIGYAAYRIIEKPLTRFLARKRPLPVIVAGPAV